MQIAHFTATPQQTRQYLERLCRFLSRKDTHAACSVMNCTKNILISPPPCCCHAAAVRETICWWRGGRPGWRHPRNNQKSGLSTFSRPIRPTTSFRGSAKLHSFIHCIFTLLNVFPKSAFPPAVIHLDSTKKINARMYIRHTLCYKECLRQYKKKNARERVQSFPNLQHP